MTNEEKFKAIVDRLKIENWCDDPSYISVIMIISYLTELQKKGILETRFSINPKGSQVVAVCQEFDWSPSDEDISKFVSEMIENAERPAFNYMLRLYRDNKEKLFKDFDDSKKI